MPKEVMRYTSHGWSRIGKVDDGAAFDVEAETLEHTKFKSQCFMKMGSETVRMWAFNAKDEEYPYYAAVLWIGGNVFYVVVEGWANLFLLLKEIGFHDMVNADHIRSIDEGVDLCYKRLDSIEEGMHGS